MGPSICAIPSDPLQHEDPPLLAPFSKAPAGSAFNLGLEQWACRGQAPAAPCASSECPCHPRSPHRPPLDLTLTAPSRGNSSGLGGWPGKSGGDITSLTQHQLAPNHPPHNSPLSP